VRDRAPRTGPGRPRRGSPARSRSGCSAVPSTRGGSAATARPGRGPRRWEYSRGNSLRPGHAAYGGGMNDLPFGFSLPEPNHRDKNGPARKDMPGGGQENPFGQLGEMLSQLGQMLSQAGSSTRPVNYDLAKQIAMQRLAETEPAGAESPEAVADAAR